MFHLKLVAKTWTNHIDSEYFIHIYNINVPMRKTRAYDVFRPHIFRTDWEAFHIQQNNVPDPRNVDLATIRLPYAGPTTSLKSAKSRL
jgi:hypothetical protein